MRRCSPIECSSSASESSSGKSDYTRSDSDADDDVESDTDVTDVDAFTDKNDDEDNDDSEDSQDDDEDEDDEDDDACLSPNEDLPPEYYLQQLENFDEQEYTKQDYKDSTTRLIDRMEDQWNQCWTYLNKEPYRNFATVSIASLNTFFDWMLSQRRVKRGRRRRGTKHVSSLGTYWKVFRLVYERATGEKIDGKMNRSMRKVLRKLAKKHSLTKIGREKTCMYVEDLGQVLRTNLATTEKKYPHGRCRIQVQLFLQLAGFTANRPQAILGLRYRHIQCSAKTE
ncbi:hypothetical protein K458DRAFT_422443 [Lentithecium fluviatile CBS 122367]|uniref:Uncharacterized protein n=1 Tax=Lentithecium fluviatile CBS 122367 TaxID=1168545 RepID=A0A6G1ILU0_9PLEO|nr:hypothetical protein K458DRAFT_422443 [Lentithecium fluviatile CBS 122367]